MNYTSITATAQGIVTYTSNGSEFIKYDKLVQNKKIMSPKIQRTQESIYLI
jgi:hypothetical protein